MSKYCPYCGEQIADSAKKCRYCGERLPTTENHNPQPIANQQPRHPVYPQRPQQSLMNDYDNQSYSFFEAYYIIPFIKRYADFKGYSSRSDFWYACLMNAILASGVCGIAFLLMCASALYGSIIGSVLMGLYSLFVFVPSLALGVRRLRDAGKNPLLLLLTLIPFGGSVILLVMYCLPSKEDADFDDEYYDVWARWSGVDWAVTSGSLLLLFIGMFLSFTSMAGILGGSNKYDAVEAENAELADTVVEVAMDESADEPTPEEIAAEGEGYSGTYTGFLGKQPIELRLIDNNDELSGRYRHMNKDGNGEWIKLTGYITYPTYVDGAVVELEELDEYGEKTGAGFGGEVSSDETGIYGDYMSAEGKHSKFELTRE